MSRTRRSAAPMTRSMNVDFTPWPRAFSRREHMRGVSVRDTRPDARIDTIMVTANSRKMRPTRPDMNTRGRNTVAREIVMETIVKPISLAPLSVAISALSPCSIRRTVFSRNTMASSTRKPIASVRAIRDRLSRL